MNKHFPILNFEVDPIEEGTKVSLVFPYREVGKIHRIMPSCDCSLAEDKNGKIVVDWRPSNISKELKKKGVKEVKKSVTMTVVYGPKDNPQAQHIVVLGFSTIVTSKQS